MEDDTEINIDECARVLLSRSLGVSKAGTRDTLFKKLARDGTLVDTVSRFDASPHVHIVDLSDFLSTMQPHCTPTQKSVGKLEEKRAAYASKKAAVDSQAGVDLDDIDFNAVPMDYRPERDYGPPTSDIDSCRGMVNIVRWKIEQALAEGTESVHTVVLVFDTSHFVGWGKGPTQKERQAEKRSREGSYVKYVRDSFGCSNLKQFFGTSYYDKRLSCIDQDEKDRRLAELQREFSKTGDPSLLQKITQIQELLPLSELLQHDRPVPGYYPSLYSDHKRGRPALMRYLVRSLVFDPATCLRLKPGQRVILSGHSLLPEDVSDASDIGSKGEYLDVYIQLQSTPLLVFHPADASAFTRNFFCRSFPILGTCEDHQFAEGVRREQLLPEQASSDRLAYGMLGEFRHSIGEADQCMFHFVRMLYSKPFNVSSFLIRNIDSDVVLFNGPMFMVVNFIREGLHMPIVYNDFAKAPGTKYCALHRWVMDIYSFLSEEVPVFKTRAQNLWRAAQHETLTQGASVSLLSVQRVDPQQAQREDAMWDIADSAGERMIHQASSGPEDTQEDAMSDAVAQFVAALILCGSDFSRGFYYIGVGGLLDCIAHYSEQIFPLVQFVDRSKVRTKHPERVVEVYSYHPEAVMALYKLLFAEKRSKAMPENSTAAKRKANGKRSFLSVVNLVDKQYARQYESELLEVMEGNVERLEDVTGGDKKVTRSIQDAVEMCVPSNPELVVRYGTANYYLTMVSQVGHAQIFLPDETTCGYLPKNPDRQMAKHNIMFAYEWTKQH